MAAYAAQRVDLTNKTVLVTGASGGLGLEAAQMFARAGAHVVLGCRDAARGRAATERVAAASAAGRAELLLLDLARLGSVRDAAEQCLARHPRLDVLCNNAGVMALPRGVTADGFELQFGVNHLGHFALTGLLLPALCASNAARVVTVSSSMHYVGRMRWDDLDGERHYHKWMAYAQSKLANLLFAYELQRLLAGCAAPIISVACHPGYANTNLQLAGPALAGARATLALYRFFNGILAQSAADGALPIVHAATAPDVQGGDYIGPAGVGELHGRPVKVKSSRASRDLQSARRLWQLSVERTGVQFAELT